MSLITDTISGIMGGHAAGQAANAEIGASLEAASTFNKATTTANTGINDAAKTAGQGVLDATALGAQNVTDTAAAGAKSLTDTAGAGSAEIRSAADLARAGLDPYSKAGSGAVDTLSKGLGEGGEFTKGFTGVDLQNDPGYKFRLQQAQIALERSASARGVAQGGGAAKALAAQQQGLASSEYQQAFDRFRVTQNDRVAALQDLSHSGQTAATTSGAIGVSAAGTAASLTTGAAGKAADLTVNAAGTAADLGKYGATYAGDTDREAAARTGQNTINAGSFEGEQQIQAGNARAEAILNKQKAYNGMLSGIGSAIDGAALGFMGGGGFTGALKGISGGNVGKFQKYVPYRSTETI